jgi:hypothetical protein
MTQWGRSFLLNYYKALGYFQGFKLGVAGSALLNTITDITNTSQTFAVGGSGTFDTAMASQNVAGVATYGMEVGTGSSANVAGTIQLGTLIANGNGAGQLAYGSMGITQPAGSAPLSYTFTRTFTNNSGGTITINEAGLAFAGQNTVGGEIDYLVIRDLTGGVAVLNGANTTGTYTLSYTIS